MLIPAGVIAAVKGATATEPAPQLATYQCHKKVKAGKIVRISGMRELESSPLDLDQVVLTMAGGYSVPVTHGWMAVHKAELGGYFVEYEDGYRSFSPARAFENGYTLLSTGEDE